MDRVKKTLLQLLAISATLSLFPALASASDPARGQLLYENHCRECHTSVVHVREKRKARSEDDIEAWVRRWRKQLGLTWDEGEIDDVVEYLNERYYGFDDES